MDAEPFYLAIGMTHEQYWNDECWLTQTYREAHRIRTEMDNQMAYIHGLYNYNAFGVVIGNFAQGFSKRKKEPKQYLKEPIRITRLTEREEQIKKKQAEMTIRKRLEAMSKRWGMRQKGDEKDGR